jgi:hypothetical protein
MKKYKSAYDAAKAYCASQDHLTEEDAATVELERFMLASGILKPVPHPKGWAPVEWYLDIPDLSPTKPKGWYVAQGNTVRQGPYRTKKEAVGFVARGLELPKPPRVTKLRAGEYQYQQYLILNAECAQDYGWL